MTSLVGSKKIARADLRTLGRKERKVYDAFAEDFFEMATYWRVGMLLYESAGEVRSIYEKTMRIYPPQQRRVDLLYGDPKGMYVVEFKGKITPAAVGQIEIYEHIINRRLKTLGDVSLVLAGTSVDSDVEQYCREHDITVLTFSV